MHCCSNVFTDVTSVISPTLVTLLAKRTYSRKITAGTQACDVTRQRYRGVVKSSSYCSVTATCTGKVIRQTNNLNLSTVLLFVEFNTTMALAVLTNNVIFSVQVLVKAMGVKLLKVIRTEITVL